MKKLLKNEKGLTLMEILIGILIFTLATVFIVSLVANAVDKPKVAGIKGALDYYEKESSLVFYQLPDLPDLDEVVDGLNKELTNESKFENGFTKMKNAYGNPYMMDVVADGNQTVIIVGTEGKKQGELYLLVVVKEGSTVESCTNGFGRYDKKLITLSSPYCEGDFNVGGGEESLDNITGCYKWRENKEGATITGYVCDDRNIEIPSTLNGRTVTILGENAFNSWGLDEPGLESVIIPDTVKHIKEYVFHNNDLTTVKLSRNLETIGTHAFAGNKIESIDLPETLTKIELSAFFVNKLTSVTIPQSLTEIESGVFSNNELTNIVWGDWVEKIGNGAFQENELTSVVIPNKITEIDVDVFSANKINHLVLPDNLTKIGVRAFVGNQLTTVTIPGKVESIGYEAFSGNSITKVELPPSVREVGVGHVWDKNHTRSFDKDVEVIWLD